jgi:hypothetical protein
MSPTLAELLQVYRGSDGDATRALYQRLEAIGPAGAIASNLLRACKTSTRAKRYRVRRHRGGAYDVKGWAMGNVCELLLDHGPGLGLVRWGWGEDREQPHHRYVLYVELPTGQVSFHAAELGAGPTYPGQWDGVRDVAADRILRFAAGVLDGRPIEPVATGMVRFLVDEKRHLICVPYSIDGLHAMAAELEINSRWFHRGRWPHYDVPVTRLAEIKARPDVELVSPREILRRIRGDTERRSPAPPAAEPVQQVLL